MDQQRDAAELALLKAKQVHARGVFFLVLGGSRAVEKIATRRLFNHFLKTKRLIICEISS